MVSYYNPLPYAQKHSASNLAYPAGQPWPWQSNYHPPTNHQFLGDIDTSHTVPHHHMQYYNHMFANHPSSDWHSAENFQNATQTHMLQQQHQQHQQHQQQQHQQQQHQQTPSGAGATQLNDNGSNAGDTQIADALPSPPITVSGSELSSPGAPGASSSPQRNLAASSNNSNNNAVNNSSTSSHSNNTTGSGNGSTSSPSKSPYYDWMKKQTFSAQPAPGKTRTKDKYRVVYTDYQRLELEKEYCTSRYITIRRKTELALSLQLSERQVKIWFQNRRAKERKQNKKREDPISVVQHPDLVSYMDTKPKIEPGIHHLQHSLHPMSSMAMNMPMSLHHHHSVLHHGHHHLAVPPPPQHLHQTHSQMSAAAAAAASALSM